MNSLVRASVRAAVSGVPDFGPTCPFCDARDAFEASPAESTTYHRCRDCGAYLSVHTPSNDGERIPVRSRSERYWQARAAWMRDHLGYSPRRILDLNGGAGEFLGAWPWTIRRDGIAAENDSAQIAAENGIRVFTGTIAECDPGLEYDIVSWYGGAEIGFEIRRHLRRASSWVAAGGLLAIGCPTLECRRHRFGEDPRPGAWSEAIAREAAVPSREWLEGIIESFGFTLVAEAWTGGGIELASARATKPLGGLRSWIADRSPLTQSPVLDYHEALFRRK